MAPIKFRFEGLFTFVVRRHAPNPADNGVYVLMPRTHAHGNHVKHYGEVTDANGNTAQLSGDVNLRDTHKWTPGPGPRIRHLLPYSRTTHEPVRANFLGAAFPAALEGRIVLPLHTVAHAINTVGVEWQDTNGTWRDIGRVTGVTELTCNAAGPVTIPGLGAPVTGTITFSHRPHTPEPPHHSKGDLLGHADQHASIFADKAQRFRITEDYDAKSNEKASARAGDRSPFGVDPVMCTNAGGCPEDDLTCTTCPPDDPTCGEG